MSKIAQTGSTRLAFVDWTRGLAAVIMLQGHVFHSFAQKDTRDSSTYILSQFVGGLPAVLFLFLTGLTLAFLMDGKERRGVSPLVRVVASLRRAGYLLGLAFLFRLQLWIFAWGTSPWTDLFRVDILNCMGVAIMLFSLMALFTTAERVRLCFVLGLAVAGLSPLVSQMDWSGIHPFLWHYIAPDINSFSFFPWAAYLAFGMSGGSVLRLAGTHQVHRTMIWSALAGLSLLATGQYFSSIPYSLYSRSEFWVDSPTLVLMNVGVTLLILSFAYLWIHSLPASSWSWVAQIGTTSLLVYWVHIELVYGRWLWMWKEALTLTQAAVVAVLVIVLMVTLSKAKTDWRDRQWTRRLQLAPEPAE